MENEVNNKEKDFYYANLTGMEISPYDFKFGFGRINNDNSTSNLKDAIDVEVMMSPQHAKSLLMMLSQNIAKYEDTFGTINITPKEGVIK